MTRLILTVTRACNLRCSYCPTVKDGWPALTVDQALRAIDLWVDRFGGGQIQLTGGEPLLEPEVVRAVLAAAEHRPEVERVALATNGLCLNADWLAELTACSKALVLLSLDGRPEDHRRHRRGGGPGCDAYDHLLSMGSELARLPRLVVTQTIAPDTAPAAHDNFQHLLSLGFWRFKLLPVYYAPWRAEQIEALARGLGDIAQCIRQRWSAGVRLYLANLFAYAPTPLFHAGLIVDADGSIHASNAGLASALEELLELTRVGHLDEPPSAQAIEAKVAELPRLLSEQVPAELWAATGAVDDVLSRFCRGLYPAYAAYRRHRSVA